MPPIFIIWHSEEKCLGNKQIQWGEICSLFPKLSLWTHQQLNNPLEVVLGNPEGKQGGFLFQAQFLRALNCNRVYL